MGPRLRGDDGLAVFQRNQTLPTDGVTILSPDLPGSTHLWNADLAPTTAAQRTWRWYHFAALWVGMVMCMPAYTLASSLVEGGMSGYQAIVTVFLANAIVLVPMLLIGHAGTKF